MHLVKNSLTKMCCKKVKLKRRLKMEVRSKASVEKLVEFLK